MFLHVLNRVIFVVALNGSKNFSSTCQRQFKVTVAGAAGGIGQPLGLLLKMNKFVTHLALYDVARMTPGVAADLSHINTPPKVTGHCGPSELCSAMKCANLVVIAAGVPRKPGMTRMDLFNTNATIVRDMAECIAAVCSKAVVAIITNPLNSMVPIACEVLRKAGAFDPNRVLGVTTLDLVRACTFVGEINKIDPECVHVPVIGGHSGVTIIPLLSQSKPPLQLADPSKIAALAKRIQEAGTEVVKAKAGGGSATLSTAHAAARLSSAILRGFSGEPNVVEYAYMKTKECDTRYFAGPLLFGKNGVEKRLSYGTLDAAEQQLFRVAIPELTKDIETGEKFVHK